MVEEEKEKKKKCLLLWNAIALLLDVVQQVCFFLYVGARQDDKSYSAIVVPSIRLSDR